MQGLPDLLGVAGFVSFALPVEACGCWRKVEIRSSFTFRYQRTDVAAEDVAGSQDQMRRP